MTPTRSSSRSRLASLLLVLLGWAVGGACAAGTGQDRPATPAGSEREGPALAEGRAEHAAVRLADGTVMVFGGVRIPPGPLVGDSCGMLVDLVTTVELLGPGDSSWRQVHGPMGLATTAASVLRVGPTAVLVVGGEGPDARPTNTLLRADAAAGRVSPPTALPESRARAAAVRLADGSVLVMGGLAGRGRSESDTIRIDPATLAIRPAAPPATSRIGHGAALLPDGTVLVVGGWVPKPTASVERYDPRRDSWSDAAPLPTPRTEHRVIATPSGIVVVGGRDAQRSPLGSVLRYDARADAWMELGALSEPRANPAVALLPGGSVVVTGGRGAGSAPVAAVDLVTSGGEVRALPPLRLARVLHTASAIDATTVLVVGGLVGEDGELRSTDRVEWYGVPREQH